jgi:S-adenosylmethionine:tRNA ribosyltransferase-isomerase
MRTAEFDFELPAESIAQTPAEHRDASRLLVLQRQPAILEHRLFTDLPGYLKPGDVLVLNNSRVISARLRGVNAGTGGSFELLLLEENGANDWWVMMRPGKRGRVGTRISILDRARNSSGVVAVVREVNGEGHRRVEFTGAADIVSLLDELGEIPLPPYIVRAGREREALDKERYQTVYARAAGSVAAPTAGLHFTPEMLARCEHLGVAVCFVTLHVGLGTFAPVKAERLEAHVMHEERYEVSAESAETIARAKRSGGRVIAVGTTLESVAAQCGGQVAPHRGRTRIFIYPPRQFAVVDALLTNFHLPRSTLLMLVSAFAAPGETRGRELILNAYAEAVREKYRFFSYGDAMLIL